MNVKFDFSPKGRHRLRVLENRVLRNRKEREDGQNRINRSFKTALH